VDDPKVLRAAYRNLVVELDPGLRDEKEDSRIIEAVKKWCADHTRWLIALDNVGNLEELLPFLPGANTGFILLTTHLPDVVSYNDPKNSDSGVTIKEKRRAS
jgi:hypothetical protein